MEWSEFNQKYKEGTIEVAIDKSTAMNLLLQRKHFVHNLEESKKRKHLQATTFSGVMTFAIIGSAIGYFVSNSVSGYIPLVLLLVMLLISNPIRNRASQYIIDASVNDKRFYNLIRVEEIDTGKPILLINNKV